MTLYVLQLETNKTIKLWNITKDNAVCQSFDNGNKSKKATCKIKEYNGNKYITCLGKRYYLDKFTKVEL